MSFNPFRWIKETIVFLYKDTKSDIQFVISILKGDKSRVRKISDEEWKTLSFKSILKENWIWFILIILAVLVGYFFAAKVFQQKCNEYIYTNYIVPHFEETGTKLLNWTSNLSFL